MEIFRTKTDLQQFVQKCKIEKASIGFVPTMGALHAGHIALIEKAKEKSHYTIASIFVNPTQFNDKADFSRYPRNEAGDIQMLEKVGCDAVFLPDTSEMYSGTDELLPFDFHGLDLRYEGAYRPGHFQGVVTIVDKLFRLVCPEFVFMGEKDFQQLAIVKLLARTAFPSIEIVGCPTVRESNGLARSSRNAYLNDLEREQAALIYQILIETKKLWNLIPFEELTNLASQRLNSKPFELEYYSLADAETLEPLRQYVEKNAVILTAVRLGNVRLIDNLRIC